MKLLPGACLYCSSESQQISHGGKCPKVKAIEYHPDGSVKRVEFHDFGEFSFGEVSRPTPLFDLIFGSRK